ncbi:MAG: hypothetical protein R3F33_03925 [Planctomycetota bacterium]
MHLVLLTMCLLLIADVCWLLVLHGMVSFYESWDSPEAFFLFVHVALLLPILVSIRLPWKALRVLEAEELPA